MTHTTHMTHMTHLQRAQLTLRRFYRNGVYALCTPHEAIEISKWLEIYDHEYAAFDKFDVERGVAGLRCRYWKVPESVAEQFPNHEYYRADIRMQ